MVVITSPTFRRYARQDTPMGTTVVARQGDELVITERVQRLSDMPLVDVDAHPAAYRRVEQNEPVAYAGREWHPQPCVAEACVDILVGTRDPVGIAFEAGGERRPRGSPARDACTPVAAWKSCTAACTRTGCASWPSDSSVAAGTKQQVAAGTNVMVLAYMFFGGIFNSTLSSPPRYRSRRGPRNRCPCSRIRRAAPPAARERPVCSAAARWFL